MANVVKMPRERITQRELEILETVLAFGPRHLRMVRDTEDEWLAKPRQGAVIEPGELDLVECEEREVVRRLNLLKLLLSDLLPVQFDQL